MLFLGHSFLTLFIFCLESMLRITTCIHWITCTGVLQKFGMGFQEKMPWSLKKPWRSICQTYLKNILTCFISLWVTTSLSFIIVESMLCYGQIQCTRCRIFNEHEMLVCPFNVLQYEEYIISILLSSVWKGKNVTRKWIYQIKDIFLVLVLLLVFSMPRYVMHTAGTQILHYDA